MKVNKALIALLVAIICGTGVFAQKSVQIIKPSPTYGGFELQFKVTQVKGVKYSVTYQFSALQSFPSAFVLRTDYLMQDTINNDSVFRYTFTISNTPNMPDPPSNFWIRIKMSDSTGIYYSDTQYVETWAIPKSPWFDTTQSAVNNAGTVSAILRYYSNVNGTLKTYGKFGSGTGIWSTTYIVDSINNLISTDSNGLTNPKVLGIPSGSTFYVGYELTNAGGSYKIGPIKVSAYVQGGQKPTGTLDSLYLKNPKSIRIRVKGVFFNTPGYVQISFGVSPLSLLDTLPRILFTGNGIEYASWQLDSLLGNTTYFFKVLFVNSKGTFEISGLSKKIEADPIPAGLLIDTTYSDNLDMSSKTFRINTRSSFRLATGITSGEIWNQLADNPNFTTPKNSNSYNTIGTTGITPYLVFNNVNWDTTVIYYTRSVLFDGTKIVYSENTKIVYQPRLRAFRIWIDGIKTDIPTTSAVITLKYENTEGSNSNLKMSISEKPDMTNSKESPVGSAASFGGSIQFPIKDLVSGKTYYIQGIGSNNYGKSTMSDIQSFTLGTNTGVREIQKPSVSLYPNPAVESFTISIPNNENYVFELFDMNGKLVHSQEIQSETSISRNGLQSGIYFYRVGASTGKIVFQ